MRPQYDVPVPLRLQGRPRDHRGYIIPYFVAWVDEDGKQVPQGLGTPDFRVMDHHRWARCEHHRFCWLCGEKLGNIVTFCIGPMCALTRTTAEPPNHLDCSRYAAQVCPFMLRPRMVRNTKDLPPNRNVAGIMLDRNPGVMCLWKTRSWTKFKTARGPLITVGDPVDIEWWAEGRQATRAEVLASVESGLPALRAIAAKHDGEDGQRELEEKYIPRLEALLPNEQTAHGPA